MEPRQHWDRVYTTKSSDEVSWYQERAAVSLRLIRGASVDASAPVIDVGGGASTLVDDLLAAGFDDLTVLDISGAALMQARSRLGDRGMRVRWLEGDVTSAALPPHGYDVWHDRAVFHFLTTEADRRAYVKQVLHSVRPGGHVIVSTFAEDGPTKCSGLPVRRYSFEQLHAEFGSPFQLVQHEREEHLTPFGTTQSFVYCYCRLQAP